MKFTRKSLITVAATATIASGAFAAPAFAATGSSQPVVSQASSQGTFPSTSLGDLIAAPFRVIVTGLALAPLAPLAISS